MFTYKVTTPRFYNDSMHGPGTGRDFIKVDKPFPKDKDGNLPEGLELVEKAAEKKVADKVLNTVLIKKVMKEMIEKNDGCTPEGIPTMKPLKAKTKLNFSQEVRDELLLEIKSEGQSQIEKDDVSFTSSPSAVKTL